MKIIHITLIIIGLSILGCQNQKCDCEFDTKLIAQNDSLVDILVNQSDSGFEKHWKRFGESPLNNRKVESFRFSIRVTLADYFKMYRVEKKEQNFSLHVKEYAIQTTTKFQEDSLMNTISKEITEGQWKEIKDEFEGSCFWTMATDIEEDDRYLDGSIWSLEAANTVNNCTKSNYHIVGRNSPNDSTSFIKICNKFFELDSLNLRRF